MTATWMVLLYGDEGFWTSASPEVKDRIMDEHRAYAAACAERGYKILGGEELEFSSSAITARRPDGGPSPSRTAPTARRPSTSAATTSSRPTTPRPRAAHGRASS